MAEVAEVAFDLKAQCEHALSDSGRLSLKIPGFVARAEQQALSLAMVDAIDAKSLLVAEAGTGTGKTFAYLVPALLSGKKALISTATKTLQDQLFNKDLPALIDALALPTTIQNLKGRQNYICKYRTELFSEEGNFATKKTVSEILLVRKRLAKLKDGVKGELPEIKEASDVWPFVTSTTENCLNKECPHFEDCFLVKARRRALKADLVVINHHLFFADARLKSEGFGELLPGFEVVVFDEAHQIKDTATNFYGKRLSTWQIESLLKDIVREWPVLSLANQPFNALKLAIESAVDDLKRALNFKEESVAYDMVARNPAFNEGMAKLQETFETLEVSFETLDDKDSGLDKVKERLMETKRLFLFFQNKPKDMIVWVSFHKRSVVFNATPLDIAKDFNQLVEAGDKSFIFTSATLTTAQSFASFTKPLGITHAKDALFPSPFDYKTQSILYLPRGLPDPKNPNYYDVLLERALPIINASRGRTFFLFTSHKALNLMANMIKPHLDFPLLIQGDEAKPILLSKFRAHGNAVLLGTATFWEGVDVKGEALSCVIIDKLPFGNHTSPVNRGKIAHIKSQGLSPFDELTLPEAILALKQGVGRLIRDEQDQGVLMIADPRLYTRAYGQTIFESLPNMTKTRDEANVIDFIKQCMSEDETTSH